VPGVRASVAFALKIFLAPLAHLVQAAEAAAVAPQDLFHPVPEVALAEAWGNTEVHADIGDGPANGAAAYLGREFFLRGQAGRVRIVGAEQGRVGTSWLKGGLEGLGTRAASRFGWRTVVGLQLNVRRPGEAQIAAPGGAGQEILLQGERAEHAALQAVQNGREVVGAEDGGGGGEFRGGGAGGGGRGEVAGVGDEGGEDVENSPDAPWDGAGFCRGRGGWGCSCHGLVIAGSGEQSKNFMMEFLMRGYAGRAPARGMRYRPAERRNGAALPPTVMAGHRAGHPHRHRSRGRCNDIKGMCRSGSPEQVLRRRK
jgi:hypothetical protein